MWFFLGGGVEIVGLDPVGDYEEDGTGMLEDVPKRMVIKNLKVWCACVSVLVFVCVCHSVCRVYVFVRTCICIF